MLELSAGMMGVCLREGSGSDPAVDSESSPPRKLGTTWKRTWGGCHCGERSLESHIRPNAKPIDEELHSSKVGTVRFL